MQTMTDRLAGNRLRYISDLALTVATLLALVGMVGYCKICDALWHAPKDRI